MAEPDPTPRPLQFSLRTMFGVTSAIGLFIGMATSIGVAFAIDVAALVAGFALCTNPEMKHPTSLFSGCLLLAIAAIALIAALLPQVH
jgi:hypothetical protein